ncbi:hypothetical protein [Bradyrhizobium sp. USDA 241]|uniref:hypothetical protein n=1 Tax=Bradyrhizobium sp. USDA 241 TaxID=3377725 RepID=UPI003C78D6FA
MQEIDLDLLRNERTVTIGTVFPESMATAIEERAKSELISRSSWLRRVVLAELQRANA